MVAAIETSGFERLSLDAVVAFAAWLKRSGVHIAVNRRAEQALRYMAWRGQVGLILLDGDATLRPNTIAKRHLGLFWRGDAVLTRPTSVAGNNAARRARILARDGSDCCICGQSLGDDISLEHWVAQGCDGTDDDANIGLAHKRCNEIVGNFSVCEKLILRDVIADYVARHTAEGETFNPADLPSTEAIRSWGRVGRYRATSVEEDVPA